MVCAHERPKVTEDNGGKKPVHRLTRRTVGGVQANVYSDDDMGTVFSDMGNIFSDTLPCLSREALRSISARAQLAPSLACMPTEALVLHCRRVGYGYFNRGGPQAEEDRSDANRPALEGHSGPLFLHRRECGGLCPDGDEGRRCDPVLARQGRHDLGAQGALSSAERHG
mgnify:CR=1 FL=1